MSIDSTTQRPAALQQSQPSRLSVPWSTVLPLAAAMAYADGFWMTSLRGAVGAIERTQSPFASWWRESTFVLPVFVFAVLAALTLALRWFGPVLRKPRTVVATALLIVAAGTIVGLAVIVASSAYDYHLQSMQLQVMDSMRSIGTVSALAQDQHATLAAHARGVLYVSRWLLLTNLVLVAWLVAMRGGRLKLGTARRAHDGATDSPRETGSRVADLRLLLVAGLVGSAAIHATVVPEHLREWTAAGVFFILLTAAQLAVAALLFARRERAVLRAAGVISIVALVLWLYSHTAGMPFGPGAGVPAGVGLPDGAACALELATLLAAVVLLRATGWLRRAPASAHLRALTLVAVIAVTAIGLAGTGSIGFDDFGGSGSQPATPGMNMSG